MPKYDDLYIRATLTDPGNVPRTGMGLSSSPDIIPYGQMPVDNPDTFFVGDNFNKVLSKDLVYGGQNYIYLRGLNLAAGATTGDMYCYYSPSNLVLYPSIWRTNVLYTQNGVDHVPVRASTTNAGFAPDTPLLWTPALPPPGHHFCMISRVTTAQHPNPIPNTGGFSDFAQWVAGNGGIGWRNVTVVNTGSPEIVFRTEYDQEDEPGLMDVLITAVDVPIGAEVWFSSGTKLENGKFIAIPPTKITQNPQTWGTQAHIPSNWKTTFVGGYRSNGGKPGPNFSVALRVQFAPPTSSKLYSLGTDWDACGFGDCHMFDWNRREYVHGETFFRSNERSFADGPVRPVLLGSVSVRGEQNP